MPSAQRVSAVFGDGCELGRGDRLEGWKAIARYFQRTVRTIQRWEHEGLPVRRHLHSSQSTVYAYKEELDAWRSERKPKDAGVEPFTPDTTNESTLCALSRYYWAQRTTESIQRSIALADAALNKNPQSPHALGLLARSYITWASLGHEPPKDAVVRALEYARRAIALNANVVEAHQALAYALLFHEWQWAAAKEQLDLALKLDPSEAMTFQLFTVWHIVHGAGEIACVISRHAEALQPRAPILAAHSSWMLLLNGQHTEALDKARRLIHDYPHFWRGHWNLAIALNAIDKPREALEALEVAAMLTSQSNIELVRVALLARAGDRAAAEALLAAQHQAGWVSPYWEAYAHMGFGAHDAAIASLQRAVREREWFVLFMKHDPGFEPLRQRPEFHALCRAISFP